MIHLYHRVKRKLNKLYFLINQRLLSIHYGEKQVSLHDTLRLFFYHVSSEDLDTKATSVAFKFTLALFPATIFLFNLLPYIPVANLSEAVLGLIERSIPEQFYDALYPTLQDIATRKRGGLLSVGFFLTLYFSMSGMVGIITAFNNHAHEVELRPWWQVRLTALMLTFMLALVFALVAFMLLLGTDTLHWLTQNTALSTGFEGWLLELLRYVLISALFFVSISIIYYFAPTSRGKWKFISPGALIAAGLGLLASVGFSFYLNNFFANDKLYGSLASFIGLMLWFYLLSVVLIVGYEINMSVTKAYKITKKNFFRRKS